MMFLDITITFHKITAPVWKLCMGGIGEVVFAMTMLIKSNKVEGEAHSVIQMKKNLFLPDVSVLHI